MPLCSLDLPPANLGLLCLSPGPGWAGPRDTVNTLVKTLKLYYPGLGPSVCLSDLRLDTVSPSPVYSTESMSRRWTGCLTSVISVLQRLRQEDSHQLSEAFMVDIWSPRPARGTNTDTVSKTKATRTIWWFTLRSQHLAGGGGS